MKSITLYEYGPPLKVGAQNLKHLQWFNGRSPEEIISIGYNGISAKQFVGVFRVKGLTVEILPKLCKSSGHTDKKVIVGNLLYMLQYTRRLNIEETDTSNMHKTKANFFEILVYLFCRNLIDVVQNNLYKQYVANEDNLNYIRGKLIVTRNIKENSVMRHKFYCGYDEFTENNPLNQILRFTIEELRKISIDNENQRLLSDLSLMFSDVSYKKISLADFSKLSLNRLNEAYKPILNLSKFFIENSALELSAGQEETFSFLFDMNKLFEEFVYEFLRRHKSCMGIESIRRPKSEKKLTDVEPKYNLQPDIAIIFKDKTCCLIDTKYKMTYESGKIKPSPSDMYQIFAYCVRYECSGMLLFPKVENNDNNVSFGVINPSPIHFKIGLCQINLKEHLRDETKLKEDFKNALEKLK